MMLQAAQKALSEMEGIPDPQHCPLLGNTDDEHELATISSTSAILAPSRSGPGTASRQASRSTPQARRAENHRAVQRDDDNHTAIARHTSFPVRPLDSNSDESRCSASAEKGEQQEMGTAASCRLSCTAAPAMGNAADVGQRGPRRWQGMPSGPARRPEPRPAWATASMDFGIQVYAPSRPPPTRNEVRPYKSVSSPRNMNTS